MIQFVTLIFFGHWSVQKIAGKHLSKLTFHYSSALLPEHSTLNSQRKEELRNMGNISKPRAWAIVTILVVATIVALAVGLGVGLGTKKKEEKVLIIREDCPPAPTSSRLTKDSPLYVTPSETPEGRYRFASVSTKAQPCVTYGTETMAVHGGSAVDAAIVSILCTSVYLPQSCGIGGGFFMTFYKKSENKAYAIMAREMAPGHSSQDMYTNVSSVEGGMSIGIPGEVKGLWEAHQLGGKLPWKDLYKPAIQMATDGFKVGRLLKQDIDNNKVYYDRYQNLKDMLTNADTGELYKEGETMRLPKLAETLRKIADDPFTFYNGTLADDIVADIAEGNGNITLDDLHRYTAAIKNPLSFKFQNNDTMFSPPPPSSGGVLLLILNILDGYNMSASDFNSVDKASLAYHRIIEAFKHGFAVRSNIGDADEEDEDFKAEIDQLVTNMTSKIYAASIRKKITDMAHSLAYYNPDFSSNISDAGTAHLSVLAPNGDAVAITSTINVFFGSKVVGSRTGIVFNDEMDDFGKPGTVNYFGLAASPANFIKPYKRPLSSMSPSIVVDSAGDVRFVIGASGGPRIITANALTTFLTLKLGLGLKESIDYPRVHHQLVPPEVRVEPEFPQAVVDKLMTMGHTFNRRNDTSAAQAIYKRGNTVFSYADASKYGITDGY